MMRFNFIFVLLFTHKYQTFGVDVVPNEVNTTLTTYWCDDLNTMQDIKNYLKVINSNIELLSKKMDTFQDNLENNTKNHEVIIAPMNKTNAFQQSLSSCDQALKSGVYQLHLPNQPEPFFVYCMKDSSTGEAWTILQRRMNGKVDFHRKWLDYKVGFGDLYGEYWLGLDLIHALTNSRPHKLWIELGDFENLTHYANYSLFAIGNERTKFTLTVLGDYSGYAGDSLRIHVGQKFSTQDSRNEVKSCETDKKGAWWFNTKTTNCQECNLNGDYVSNSYFQAVTSNKASHGINWYSWHGNYYSLKYAHMAIRAID